MIRLSKEHGVNPSVQICFWCGEDMGVVLFGSGYNKGKEAPREIIMNYEPCDKCKENRKKGIALIEATEYPNGRAEIEMQSGIYPTGNWWVISENSAERIFDGEGLKNVMQKRVACVEEHTARMLGLYEHFKDEPTIQ